LIYVLQKKLQEESEATEHQLRNVLQKKLQKEREATEHQSRKIRLSGATQFPFFFNTCFPKFREEAQIR
jgi:hypothetical protein